MKLINKIKKIGAVMLAMTLMFVSVPFGVSAQTDETNFQFEGAGGQFMFVYENGFTDFNAPDCGYGVKVGKSSAESGYAMPEDPVWDNYTFKGWSALGIKADDTVDVLAEYNTGLLTTEQALDYKADSKYPTIRFNAYWEDANGNQTEGTADRAHVQFDVWDGQAEFAYNGTTYTLEVGRFFVKDGEKAADCGNVSAVKHRDIPAAEFTGWTFEIRQGENVVQTIEDISTDDALNYTVDTEYQYTFTAQWEIPETVQVEFDVNKMEEIAHFVVHKPNDENFPWNTSFWGEEVYVGSSFGSFGCSVSDPVWTDARETADFLNWDMYGAAQAIEDAVDCVLNQGYRTSDMTGGNKIVGTVEMGDIIAANIA